MGIKNHLTSRSDETKCSRRTSKKSRNFKCHLNRSIMHFLSQHHHLFYLFFIFITYTTSTPVKNPSQTIQCNWLYENCTVIQYDSLPINNRIASSSSTPTQYSTTSSSNSNSYSKVLKFAAIAVGGVALTLGILRICLMLCNSSRSSHMSRSTTHTAAVRPAIATIGQTSFKPDLPPAYAEAIINNDMEGNKLPSYDELQNAQQARSTNESLTA
jgi:hypothetical protein